MSDVRWGTTAKTRGASTYAELVRISIRLVLSVIVLAACGGDGGGGNSVDAGDPPGGTCGDGTVDAGEQCDFGAGNGAGTGCESTCTFSCDLSATTCDDGAPCNGVESCQIVVVDGRNGQRCIDGTAAIDGMSCGTGMICASGACVGAMCGDGVASSPDECDDDNTTTGDGCEANCMWSCLSTDPSRNCTPDDVCAGQGSCDDATHTCTPGTPLADNTPCGAGAVCMSGACTMLTCGNSMIDAGEDCDDGTLNGTSGHGCTANCQYVCENAATDCGAAPACQMWTCSTSHTCALAADAAQNGMSCGTGMTCTAGTCASATPVCGDGARSGTEQCDDGNTTRLDGCDPTCKFEQTHRVNDFAINFMTTMYCSQNVMGSAMTGSVARNEITKAIDTGVTDGSISIIFHMLGLDDLSGMADASLSAGIIGGTPQTSTTATYNGNSDLDWWYTTDPTTIDAMRMPTATIPAAIANGVLDAGPGDFEITVNFAGVPVTMDTLAARFRGTTGMVAAPLASTGQPPGHLASEHLDPALTSFGTMSSGELCGNTTAKSLADVLVPSVLVGCGFGKCTQCYTTAHTLLDLVTSGCDVFLAGQQVAAIQPDAARTPGDVYRFIPNSMRVVDSCTRNGQPATLSECHANAAYTTAYTFTSNRVIAK